MDREKLYLILALLTYLIIFCLSFLFAKIGLMTMSPIELIAYRFLIASLILTILKEDFGIYDIIGAAMIVIGVLGTAYVGEKKLKEDLE